MKRRVAITGVGAISALGKTADEFWGNAVAGRSGIAPIRAVDCSGMRFGNGAEAHGYAADAYFDGKKAALLDRFAQFAVIAAREAIAQAGVTWTDELRESCAVVTGSCVGGQVTEDAGFYDLYKRDRSRVDPMTIPRTMANAGASHISMEWGIVGPSFTVSTACASSAHAIGHAFWMVRGGMAEMAVTGGSEAPFSYAFLKAWEAMRVVSPDTCRPFARTRSGMILGEGAAMFILEPWENAQRRGAEILGEVCGFGMSADASHITIPHAGGAARAMQKALADAEIEPAEIGYINAHGTGTQANDASEAEALHSVFGEAAAQIPVSSTKALHGHALGAAGALEACATVFALRTGTLPPNVHYDEPDPACPLNIVANEARAANANYALSNSFAFGGLNAVLVFRKVS